MVSADYLCSRDVVYVGALKTVLLSCCFVYPLMVLAQAERVSCSHFSLSTSTSPKPERERTPPKGSKRKKHIRFECEQSTTDRCNAHFRNEFVDDPKCCLCRQLPSLCLGSSATFGLSTHDPLVQDRLSPRSGVSIRSTIDSSGNMASPSRGD